MSKPQTTKTTASQSAAARRAEHRRHLKNTMLPGASAGPVPGAVTRSNEVNRSFNVCVEPSRHPAYAKPRKDQPLDSETLAHHIAEFKRTGGVIEVLPGVGSQRP